MSFINQSAINTHLYLTTSFLAKEAIPVLITKVRRYFHENKIHLTPENNIGDPLCLIYWDNRQNLEGARVTTVSITTRARWAPPAPFPGVAPSPRGIDPVAPRAPPFHSKSNYRSTSKRGWWLHAHARVLFPPTQSTLYRPAAA